MTDHGQRRPITAREFNRLLMALILLASLAVLARLVTRQESRAADMEETAVTAAEWVRTADALYLRSEWAMAAEAYLGALEAARDHKVELDPRVYRKLAESLWDSGERRAALYFLRDYRARLDHLDSHPLAVGLRADAGFMSEQELADEKTLIDTKLRAWGETR